MTLQQMFPLQYEEQKLIFLLNPLGPPRTSYLFRIISDSNTMKKILMPNTFHKHKSADVLSLHIYIYIQENHLNIP